MSLLWWKKKKVKTSKVLLEGKKTNLVNPPKSSPYKKANVTTNLDPGWLNQWEPKS
jgi:hypothetical protein